MRTIKFRAFNIKENRMLRQKEMTELGGFYYENGVTPNPKEFHLMQFTGLHDINGVEIFEGDVVKWGHIEGGEEIPHRVAIVEINPCIQFNCQVTNYVFEYADFAYQQTNKYLEVIGNIYEHPHLIGSEK